MKKTVLFILSIVILFGCKETAYKINGSFEDQNFEGQTVLIKERINKVWTSIDSVQTNNGKFSFTGTCDSARIVYVFCESKTGEKLRQEFVLENGNINITIDSTDFVINGTAQNDILQEYKNKKNEFYKKASSYFNAHKNDTSSVEQKDEFELEMEKLNKEEVDIEIQYSKNQVNTIVGTHIFGSSYYIMSIEQKEDIIKLMNNNTLTTSRIQDIVAKLEIEKQTAKGSKYTDFKLANTQGDSLSLSELVGKSDYILIDFWASWCGPCMQTIPELKKLKDNYELSTLQILGVSLDDDADAWKNTIKSKELNWLHISDLQGWNNKAAKLYAINSIPATILINKKGIIEGRNLSIIEIKKIITSKQ